jgi:N-hydroxyarylamine O-acetyltransferase
VLDLIGYLRRLDLDHPGPPTAAALAAIHRAHVERVAYSTLDIGLGRRTTVDPYESAHRLVTRGRAGYCLHLNGALSALLAALGFDVRWHVGGVQRRVDPDPVGANANHLALTVHGLRTPACPDGIWMVDAGLGDARHQPLPLREGEYRQGPFTYRLRHSDVAAGGWRFEHDPSGSFAGMDFESRVASPADFADSHERMSTAPDSAFVRLVSALRRDAEGVDVLRGQSLSRIDARGTSGRELETQGEWLDVLADVFGLPLDDVAPGERDALWRHVRIVHEHWRRGTR